MLSESFYRAWTPRAHAVLRVATGLIMLQHGTSKLFEFPYQHAAVHLTSIEGVAGLIETLCGALLTVGLYSRLAAFLLSGEMAVAYFRTFAPRNFFPLLNGGSLAYMYCFACLYLWIAGPGAWSLDGRGSQGGSGGAPAGRKRG